MPVTARGADEYGVVLVLIVAVMVLAPFESTVLRPVINMLLGLIFVFSLWTAGSRRGLIVALAWLAMGGVVASAASQAISGKAPRLIYVAVGVLMCAATIAVIVRRLASQRRVTRHTVTGALAIYLQLGLLFAYTFSLIGLARSAGFFAQPGPFDTVSYLYFSYSTLTTVGYGDLTAGNDVGRMLVVVEAVLGQLYLVTVVAVVVGNIGRERAGQRGRGGRSERE